VRKHGRIAFVPEALPLAPRPIGGELLSSWLLRVALANGLTLAQLADAIESRFPEVSLQATFLDERLSPSARAALANFLRVPEADVKALELSHRYPLLPSEWILRPVNWLQGSPDRLAQGRARYAFCPLCLQEMVHATQTAWIRSEWACALHTHCVRHRLPLRERCAVCFIEDPVLPSLSGSLAPPSCWNCGSSLLLHRREMQACPTLTEVINLETAILAVAAGNLPEPRRAEWLSDEALTGKLRLLVQQLTTPAEDAWPPFVRIIEADPRWSHYLVRRQRPEPRVETFSWHWRFLLMIALMRRLDFQDAGQSTI
jgi:hypothetical protein